MKTYLALFLVASSADAQYSGKASKSSSLSYSFADIDAGKSGKSGRNLHESHDGMSYRMFVPSKASKGSPKSGKGLAASDEAMSFPMLSAKSTKFLAEAIPSKSSKGNTFEANVDDFDVALASKSSKGSKEDHIFGRLLVEFEDSMSYSNVIVPGKSAKLQPKSGKKKEISAVSEYTSSKAGKSVAQPEVRSSSTVSLNAIDFTKIAAPEVAPTESSGAISIVQGLFTSCVLIAASTFVI